MNIKIYHDQSHQPISNSPSTAETRNFYSEMRPSSRFYNFSPKSRTLNIPNESRYHELVEKYAPKEEDDGIDSFFDKEPLIGSKGSWSSDRPSFDDMPDFPEPNFHESETPSSTPEPPHHTAPRSSRSHSSPPSNSPRQGRYHDDDPPHPRPHSHPDSHSHHRSHPHSHTHPHRQSHRSRSHSHPNSYSNPQSSSRSQNHPPPYSHPPVPSRPPPTHYRSAEHSDDSRGKVYDDLRGYEQGLGSNHHLSSFESPSPYFTPGSDADDGNHRTIGSASGPIQFNSNIHHGSGSGELSFSKDNVLLSSSGPAGFEYINRIASSPQDEMNSFSFNSGSLEPVLFSANHEQDQYNGLAGSQDGFAAYIAGLPLAP
uniref:Uncharacterized protein n=2 Tax=Tetranychus urticae TaxID=32264 RepID=T1KMG0_TETUR